MLVIAEPGYDTKEQTESFPTRFAITQIPVKASERQRVDDFLVARSARFVT